MTITGAARVDILRRGDPVQQIKEDLSDPSCIYIGLTPKMSTGEGEGKWQIRRMENVDGVITTLFANDAKYNAAWSLRTSYFPACVGNQVVPGFTDTNVVNTPTIQWLDFTVTGQEESLVLPTGTKRFLIENDGSNTVQVAYAAGDSGVAGSYYKIGPANAHFEEEIGSDQTIYARVTAAIGGTERLIVLSWA